MGKRAKATCERTMGMIRHLTKGAALILAGVLFVTAPGTGEASSRIKDLVDVQCVRPNQLVGYGLGFQPVELRAGHVLEREHDRSVVE